MQSRMRHRVSEFQKVLNRSKTEVASTERKTVTYVSILSCLPVAVLTPLQWENFANAVNVAIFGNPHVFIHTVGIQREFRNFLRMLDYCKPVFSNTL